MLFVLLVFACIPLDGQELSWNAGIDGFLDNREYFSIGNPQTIFGSRAWGEIGADFDDCHRLRVGMNYLKEFGEEPMLRVPDLTMYYEYDDRTFDFALGAFPRKGKLNYPLIMLSDTLNYYRPNIEGVYLGIKRDAFYQYVFIDWMSRQTDTRYERFMFATSGKLNFKSVFFENYIMMSHLAGKGIPEPGFHLRDNGGASVNLGLDASQYLPLDSLSIKAGGILSIDRIRGIDPGFQFPLGFIAQVDAIYKIFGVTGLYYRGEGHTFFYGDPFYRLEKYGRLDLYVLPIHNSRVNLKVNFILHFAENQIDYSQQLLLVLKL